MDGLLRLPAQAVTPRHARHAIERLCTDERIPCDTSAAALLTSELVTNAVRHANSEVELSWTIRDTDLHVEVKDFGPGVPVINQPALLRDEEDDLASGGRGLWLVNQLADRWGVDLRDAEKSVWFELDLG